MLSNPNASAEQISKIRARLYLRRLDEIRVQPVRRKSMSRTGASRKRRAKNHVSIVVAPGARRRNIYSRSNYHSRVRSSQLYHRSTSVRTCKTIAVTSQATRTVCCLKQMHTYTASAKSGA